jgi:integrase
MNEVLAARTPAKNDTCATLLLTAGEPVHVVSQRLGHARVEITLNTYAHVLPDMQKQAAATMGAILHR